MKRQRGLGRLGLSVMAVLLLLGGNLPPNAFTAAMPVTQPLAVAAPESRAALQAAAVLEAPTLPAAGPSPAARVLAQDDQGITLEFSAPGYTLAQAEDAQGLCELPVIEGASESSEAGAPALPVMGAFVGVPAEAELELHILEVEQQAVPGVHRVCPIARPVLALSMDSLPERLGEERVADAALYARSGFAPELAVAVQASGMIRDQRVAELRYTPLQYDASTGQLRYVQRIRVRLQFGGERYLAQVAAGSVKAATAPDPAFDDVLQGTLLNFDAARAWRVAPAAEPYRVSSPEGVTNPWFRITTREAGLYRITYAELTALAPDWPWETVDPRNFHLRNQGVEVAIRVEGESDGSFDPEDWILFYGEQNVSKYTWDNIYWLTWDDFVGLRMTSESGVPGTADTPTYFGTTHHMEVDYWYQSTMPSGSGDHWYWDYLQWSGRLTRNYAAQLLNAVDAPVSATVRGLLHGYSADPSHQVRVLINSRQIYSATWPSGDEHAFSVAVPSAYILPGNNTLTLNRWNVPAPTADTYFVNWLEIDYSKGYTATNDSLFFDGEGAGTWKYRVGGFTGDALEVYDITNPRTPVFITGTQTTLENGNYVLALERTIAADSRYLALATSRYLAPKRLENDRLSRWRSPDNAADYIIVAPREFFTATQPLVQARLDAGMRVELVDVQDVYDEFGGGWLDSEAIRNFVAYAYANWERPAPAYLLLVGDGNYDFKDLQGRGERNYVPPYLADADPWMGETAADNRFVTVSGGDIWPDLHLGRLPAKTAAEVTTMVNKILTYPANASADAWKGRLLFVADNPDDGGNFRYFSDAVADYFVPAPYANQKIYYGISPYTTGAVTRAAIVSAINSGRLIVNYVGHSAIQYWANEQLMNLAAVGQLTNTQTLPFMMPMTCYEGYYIRASSTTNNSSFGESIVRKSGGGAIASWSPTGLGVANGHDVINKALFRQVFLEDLITLGPATTASKLALAGMGHNELVDTYILFGDPALQLATLPTDVQLTKTVAPATTLYPGDWLTTTLTFTNTGPARANNIVLEDVFPSMLLTPTLTYSGATAVRRPNTRFVWDVADLPPNTGGMITISARIPPDFSGIFTDTAFLTTTSRDTVAENNNPAPIVVEVIAADVGIMKTGPTRALPGETIQYVLAYGNAGTITATDVVITDLLHSQLLTPVVTFSGPTITPRPGQNFVWDVEPLPPGAQGRITITAVVNLDYRGTVENQAAISTTAPQADRSDDISALISTAVLIPDLVLEKSGPAAVLPGMDITYVITFSNLGNEIASGVIITDLVPAAVENLAVLSAGAVITQSVGSAYVWDVSDIAPDSGGIITITGSVSPAFRGVLANTASIATELPDNDPQNNTSTLETFVSIADLAVTKTGPAMALAGARITYTLGIANPDNAPASGVVVTDTLPTALLDVTVTASVPGVTARPGTAFVWDVPDLAPGARITLTVAGRVAPTYRGTLSNQAAVATVSPEASVANNTSALVETFVSMSDVTVEKTGPASVMSGGRVTYTLEYRNVDNGIATGVVLTDVLPSALVSATVDYAGPTLTPRPGVPFVWDVADLAPGAGGVVTITALVRSDAAGPIVNTASIAATGELNTANNTSAPVQTQILVPDVTLQKSGPAAVETGGSITYRLAFSNVGAATARDVVITDLLPAQLTGASFTASGATLTPRLGAPFVWDVSDLAPGAGGVVTITASVLPDAIGPIVNTASIAAASELNTANNTGGPVTTQILVPDVTLQKSGPAVVETGGSMTYRLAFSNVGAATALDVVITDLLPAQLIGASFTASGATLTPRPGAPFVWDVSDLAPGAGGVVTITASVLPDAAGPIVNTASIAAASELNTANNTGGPVTTHILLSDVTLQKSGPSSVESGASITYRLTFANTGAATARNVVITDLLPAQLTGASFTASGATVTRRPGTTFVWDVVDLAPGAGGIITITATVDGAFTGELTNAATIATSSLESDALNNGAQAITQVVQPAHKVFLPLALRSYTP